MLVRCSLQFASVLACAARLLAHEADDPIVGKWKLKIKDYDASTVTAELLAIENIAPHTFRYVTVRKSNRGQTYHLQEERICDGVERPAKGLPPGFVERCDPVTRTTITTDNGQVRAETSYTLSSDAKTLTIAVTVSKGGAQVRTDTYRYTRVR